MKPQDNADPLAAKERRSYDENSSIRLYLNEISEVPLLTPQEEIDLALRIQNGDESAREHMIKANLRLVVKIAHDYEHFGLPLLDLVSEGNIGLMKAVQRFKPMFGAKFSSYASWWIKQAIMRAITNQSKTIRIPTHMVKQISMMNRAAAQLHEMLGRDPTDEELGTELRIAAFRIAEMRQMSHRPTSLDAPIGAEDSSSLGELVEDENAETPYEQFDGEAAARIVRDLVKTLPAREAKILSARFGLDGSDPKLLEETSALVGVTRERTRQIQNRALRKLRKAFEKLNPAGVSLGTASFG